LDSARSWSEVAPWSDEMSQRFIKQSISGLGEVII